MNANFNANVTVTGNLNTLGDSGVYWSHWDAVGNPDKDISYGVLHMRVGDNAALQVAFPYSDAGYKIKTRRTNGSGVFGSWVNL